MFKSAFFLGLTSGLLATVACLVYSMMYLSLVTIDFSEAVGLLKVLANCMMVTMIGCFVFFGLMKIIRNACIAQFSFNLIITMASVAAVFFLFKADDPVFKNEDALMMIDYYKAFVMPMLFFPALSWMTLKPLFIKS